MCGQVVSRVFPCGVVRSFMFFTIFFNNLKRWKFWWRVLVQQPKIIIMQFFHGNTCFLRLYIITEMLSSITGKYSSFEILVGNFPYYHSSSTPNPFVCSHMDTDRTARGVGSTPTQSYILFTLRFLMRNILFNGYLRYYKKALWYVLTKCIVIYQISIP